MSVTPQFVTQAKTIIDYISRGVELAAALIIAGATAEAVVKLCFF